MQNVFEACRVLLLAPAHFQGTNGWETSTMWIITPLGFFSIVQKPGDWRPAR